MPYIEPQRTEFIESTAYDAYIDSHRTNVNGSSANDERHIEALSSLYFMVRLDIDNSMNGIMSVSESILAENVLEFFWKTETRMF